MRKGSRAKVQIGLRPVRRRKDGGKITEYGLRSTEGWQAVGCCAANGRDAVAPLPAGGAREVGQHVVLSLPEPARGSANPTSLQANPTRGRVEGFREWGLGAMG